MKMDLKVKKMYPKQKMLQIVLRQKILTTLMQGMTALMMIVRLRALMTHKLMSLRKKLMKLTVLIQIVIITLQKPIALLLL